MARKPWPPATIKLRTGGELYIREARIDEAKTLMQYVRKVMDVERDFYDIVGARVYAELLGWYRKRIKDPYVMVGMIDGKLAGLVNGRLMNETSTSAVARAFDRAAWGALFYCKAYYAFESSARRSSVTTGFNSWRMGFLGMAQPHPGRRAHERNLPTHRSTDQPSSGTRWWARPLQAETRSSRPTKLVVRR
jgi:hypothetical protein